MRQHIDIGSTPNDGTGDVPRIAWDKANDNFIELYTMFDDWPGNFDYWPLGGPADLTSAVTIDGNGFDLTFGSPNQLDEFNILATTSIHLHVDDGSNHTHSLFDNNQIVIDYDDGTVTMGLQISTDFQLNYDNGAGDFGGIFIGDSGGDALSQIASNGLSQIYAEDGLGATVHFNASAIGGNMLAEISADDGVDSSSLSLTPTYSSLQSKNFEVFLPAFASGIYINTNVGGGETVNILGSEGGGDQVEFVFDLDDELSYSPSGGGVTFLDIRAVKKGIEYDAANDPGDWTDYTLTTKQYVDESAGQSVTVSISSAEFLALNTTPKTLIASPGSGKFIQIISISSSLDFVSAAYATNVDVFFRYGAGGPAINSGSWNIAQGADEYFRFALNSDPTGTAVASFVNQPVVAEAQTGDPTTGDGTGKVYITYRIVTL